MGYSKEFDIESISKSIEKHSETILIFILFLIAFMVLYSGSVFTYNKNDDR